MPYKDQERQKEYQRQWQREKRAAEVKPSTNRTLNPDDIKNAQGLLELLADTITEVDQADGDIFIKARLKGYLISIGLKCVETAELEARLSSLEEVLKGRRKLG